MEVVNTTRSGVIGHEVKIIWRPGRRSFIVLKIRSVIDDMF